MLTPTTLTPERATPARQQMTLAEFFQLPEGPPYYEFEQGELIPMPRPHARHQDIILALGAELRPHIVKEKRGRLWPEIEVHLPGENRVYVPDLVFLAADHLDRYADADGRIHGTPDLAVEVLSPGTERRDRTLKLRIYQRAGVKWYWLIYSDTLWIEEYRLTAEGYVLAQSVPPGESFAPGLFPGFILDLAALLGETVAS
jgi:Uma2 family endonuclease